MAAELRWSDGLIAVDHAIPYSEKVIHNRKMTIVPFTEQARQVRVREMLRLAGLRPTQQRLSLGALLFSGQDRHFTAEQLHDEARRAGIPVSVATVYNTLHQFTHAGLLREVLVDGSKAHFDTNTSPHHHFLFEDGSLMDIPASQIEVLGLPDPPAGAVVRRIDILVHLAKPKR